MNAIGFRDGRLPPFSWVSHATVRALRKEFTGRDRAPAMAIYLALAVCASKARVAGHDGEFAVARAKLADVAGVSLSTIDRYVPRFVNAGLLNIESRKVEGLPNRWTLIEPDEGASDRRTGSVSVTQGGASDRRTTTEEAKARTSSKEEAPNPQIAGLCEILQGAIVAKWRRNGIQRPPPTITKAWLTAMRLLVEKDGEDPDLIERMIHWSQEDAFWSMNVESAPTLRKQFTRIVAASRAPTNGKQTDRARRNAEARALFMKG